MVARFFAIRIGDFVEIRSSTSPPKGVLSKLTRKFERIESHWAWNPDQINATRVTTSHPVTVILQSVVYTGGRVVGGCSVKQWFYRLRQRKLKHLLRRDGMIEISPELKRFILKRGLDGM